MFHIKPNDYKNIQQLPLNYVGITIHNQDIDLMLIANSNNIEELKLALSNITNINIPLSVNNLSEEDFKFLRQQVYDIYLNQLISEKDFLKNPSLRLSKKIQHLINSGKLSREEIQIILNIISISKNKEEIKNKLKEAFSKERLHLFYQIIRDYSPIEKEGIKNTTLEASQNLLYQIQNNYNSITIDEEVKYQNIVLEDGSFDFRHLQKALNFAKMQKKQIRLNTIIFYMDCPQELYNLEKNEQNRLIVKQKLSEYIEQVTKFIRENGYDDTVRSIDVLNELLNRFPLISDNPYHLRGDIPQIINNDFDNINAGWLKHLTIEDLCDIISIARKNLPNTDFMYNDDNLTDPKKIEATEKILERIKKYENEHQIKIIDSIGTQMHIDNNLTKEEIEIMLTKLSKLGLPIEITEFDMAMLYNIENLSDKEIETTKQEKMNEIYDCIDKTRLNCNIRGFTIWSKTDTQNFRLRLENIRRIQNGEPTIETVHGGFFTENMTPKSEAIAIEKKREASKKLILSKQNNSGYVKFIFIPITIILITIISITIGYILYIISK